MYLRTIYEGDNGPHLGQRYAALHLSVVNPSESYRSRELQCTSTTHAVHAASAAYRTGHLSEGCARDGIAWVVELWGIAQLKGIDASFQTDAFPYRKCLEGGYIVLNIAGTIELIAP